MAKTSLGIIVPFPVGEWNSTTQYKLMNVVRYGNGVYWAKSNNQNTPVTDTNVWFPLGYFGDDGIDGKNPVFEIGSVTTGAPGTNAGVEMVPDGTTPEGNPKYLINYTIPRGAPGTGAGNVVVEESGLIASKSYMFKPAANGSAVGEFIEYTAPNIPTKVSELQNDSGFQTSTQVGTQVNSHNSSGTAHQDIRDEIGDKISKIPGKGLSTEDYTTEEKQKLAGLEGSKFKGEYTSLEELDDAWPTADAGSYAYVDAGVGADTQKYIWDSSDSKWVISGSTGEETPATIKEKYESNPDTNAFTDDDKTKLSGLRNAIVREITIAATDWQGSAAPFSVEISDTDIVDSRLVLVNPVTDSYSAYKDADIYPKTATEADIFTLYANEAKPTVSITIQYTILY